MALVSRPDYDSLADDSRERWDALVASGNAVTHMKQTLLHSAPAFDALMQWFPLRDALLPVIGERGVIVLSYAISTSNDCLLCSLYFRRALIARGEDPLAGDLTDIEEDLAAFGRALVADGRADAELSARLLERYGEPGLVLLVAFAGLMIATNLVNTALDVDLDASLVELHTDEAVQ